LLGVSYDVEPDVLVASSRDPFYRVAEIKSYVDRRGKTKPADISSACRQAAVGVYALSETVAGLAVANPVLYVPDIPAVADVIMRKPQSMRAVLYAQPIESEYASVAAIPQMPPQDIAALEALLQSISPTATLSDRAVIDAIAIHYLDTCREHCPLYGYCKTRALEAGDPAVLDVRAREVLAPAGDLRRGYALREGTVTSYRSPEEEDLALRLREVDREWKEALAQ
jgi:hypothetical protein